MMRRRCSARPTVCSVVAARKCESGPSSRGAVFGANCDARGPNQAPFVMMNPTGPIMNPPTSGDAGSGAVVGSSAGRLDEPGLGLIIVSSLNS
jgi:hypothetical protein